MTTVLLILAFYAALISVAATAVLIVILLKLKKIGFLESANDEQAKENDNLTELIRINYEIANDLERSDERTVEILCKLEETNTRITKLLEEYNFKLVQNTHESSKVAELSLKLTEERNRNNELSAALANLEAEKHTNEASGASDKRTSERVKELEELVKYKDEYYAEMLSSEKKLRSGVCDAIDSLIKTRGSDSSEYLEEQIEKVIKLLDDLRSRKK